MVAIAGLDGDFFAAVAGHRAVEGDLEDAIGDAGLPRSGQGELSWNPRRAMPL